VSFDELPDLLTVEEAGKFLRIGRGLAYQLARRNVETSGREGLPVIQLGRRLLVPKRQVERILNGQATPEISAPSNADQPIAQPKRRRRPTVGAQLALLPTEDKA
jgi:hypothetical protein